MHTRIALVVTVLLVGVVAPFAAPAAAQSGSAVGFGAAETTATQGDIATIELQVRNTDDAILRVSSADQQYRALVDVRDGDGDGTVRVRFNTFRGPGEDATVGVTAADADDDAELLVESSDQTGAVLDTGRYNMIVSTATTSVAAVLRLEEPGDVSSNTSVVAPGTPLSAADSSGNASAGAADGNAATNASAADAEVRTAAAGDLARTRFRVSGLGGAVEPSPPARNMVFPADSAPNARTTHTLQTTPNETIAMRSLTVDYGVDGSTPPADIYRLTRGDIDTLGVDETGDGYVDRSARFAVQNIRTSTDGRMTLTFDRPVTVSANDSLLAAYEVQNPETVGARDVTATLTGETTTYRDSGTVLYGPAGQGTLGYGVDLRFESADQDASPTAPLSALDVTYDASAGDLVADTDTGALETGEYAVRLQTNDSAPPELPQVHLTERFEVVEPDAEFETPSVADESRLSVAAETNLAPDNTVIVRVDAQETGGGVSQVLNCVATVESDGSIGCEFDLSKSASEFDISVSIRRNDTVIAGPARFS
jgi:hypothetical protein